MGHFVGKEEEPKKTLVFTLQKEWNQSPGIMKQEGFE